MPVSKFHVCFENPLLAIRARTNFCSLSINFLTLLFQETGVLGVILGTVLGFLAGAVVVCCAYICYYRRTKGYSPSHHEANGRTTTIDYFAVSQSPQTKPTLLQPNVYTFSKPPDELYPEITPVKNAGQDEENRVRITQPYEADAIETIPEDSSESGEQDNLGELNGAQSREKFKKAKIEKRLSLPAMFRSNSELVHHSPEEFLRKKSSAAEDVCQLEFSLFYDTSSKELHITVIQMSGIPSPDERFLRLPNCSVKMRILPEMLSWQWTRKISRTSNPVFNETFIVPGFVHNKLRECTVHFVVLDFDHVQDNVYVVGEVFMPLSEVRANRLEKSIKRINPLSL